MRTGYNKTANLRSIDIDDINKIVIRLIKPGDKHSFILI
jgi:hypothetical protein